MSIVEVFGGLQLKNDQLSFSPKISRQWTAYAFNVNFRNQILKVSVSPKGVSFVLEGNEELTILVDNKAVLVGSNSLVTV